MNPTIFAIGTAAPENRTLNNFIVKLADKPQPKLCFLGTAAGEPTPYFEAIQQGFAGLAGEVAELSLFRPPTADLRGYLSEFDIVYVGGGNTKSLLALWREWEVDVILHDLWQAGTVMTGISAGCICWFEHGVTDSIPGPLTPLRCLGWLPDVCCPHFGDEPARRPTFHAMIGSGLFPTGIGVDANCGLLYKGHLLEAVVSAEEGAMAYRLERDGKRATETPLPPTLKLPVIS